MQLHKKQSHRKQWRHTGPLHHTEDTVDDRSFTRQAEETPGWTQSISTQAGLQDAATAIGTTLLNTAAR